MSSPDVDTEPKSDTQHQQTAPTQQNQQTSPPPPPPTTNGTLQDAAATPAATPATATNPNPNAKGKPKISEKAKLDAAVIGTNNSSITSKRSVERLYSHEDEQQFLRYFVKKPQRRSPILMQAVEYVVHSFLQEELPHLSMRQKKVVVNLGCGYDPLPFQCLAKEKPNAEVLYVDIDYPDLITIKAGIIAQTPGLNGLLTDKQHHETPVDHVHYQSNEYIALGCDLRDLDTLQRLFEKHGLVDHAVFFTAEVSLTYMAKDSVDALIAWAASLPDARFSILEQIMPDGPHHPFARTMLKHFNALNTPLKSISAYPRLEDQVKRYSSRGWKSVDACDLLAFWSNRIPQSEKERIDAIPGEPFDEFEEFFIFCQHYFILCAHNISNPHTPFNGPGLSWNAGGAYHRYPSSSNHGPYPGINMTGNKEKTLVAEYTPSPHLKRRFGAAAATGKDSFIYHGGQGQTTRLGSALCITHSAEGIQLDKQTSPSARVCHTMTTMPNGKILLVGGRTSPDKPVADTWLLEGGVWRRVQDLPVARYRHTAAVPGYQNTGGNQVLIYGGRGGNRSVLGDFWLWCEEKGWREVMIQPIGSGSQRPPPRFATSMCWTDRKYGAMGGGLDAKGNVLDDFWRLELHQDPETGSETIKALWSMVNMIASKNLWKRFGGQMVYAGNGSILYVGGVSGRGLMRREDEILQVCCNKVVVKGVRAAFPQENAPFLVGHSVVVLQDRVIISGGGGVCFSMGSCTNDGIWSITNEEMCDSWRFIEEGYAPDDVDVPMPDSPAPYTPDQDNATNETIECKPLPRVTISTPEEFSRIVSEGLPVVLENLTLGPCLNKWIPSYLSTMIGDEKIVVHMSKSSAMSFQQKNFKYIPMAFNDFITSAFPLTESPNNARIYFRSLSQSKPRDKPTRLSDDFPQIAADFILPATLKMVSENIHSSPLRISSADVGMWLHYDGMANVLCHISGRKLFRLYPPRDVSRLSFPHGETTSTIPDIFAKYIPGTTPYEVELGKGDVVYIPPLWLHAAKPLTPCVAVNVFLGIWDRMLMLLGRMFMRQEIFKRMKRGGRCWRG
ncbi:Similar to Leucine carboxyl methyltransferase 2; acc. no. Q5BH52 [Pyronema omphalodes CBS 100304]|uniref:tRNA wybutosine-synthesizing protein 4 n=1 Tax=Pyronema omphalodes (strain CBS 100304) TaxID=1076935 RepID=U4LK46_PYROM|nr:Similar to Leucine carboxyl methyltransferase 2; acc. no. Q5BH52 [Pyronema omphalodes CBS 100304]